MEARPASISAQVALVPVQKRIIEWHDGQPVLAVQPVLSKAHVTSLYFITAAQPYEVTDPLDPDFGKYDGMTIAEVLVRKQLERAAKSGNTAEIEIVMDRLIGKPLSRSENLTVNDTYENYLKRLAGKISGGAIDVTPVKDNNADVLGDLA